MARASCAPGWRQYGGAMDRARRGTRGIKSMRPEVFARWAIGVVALGGLATYLAGAAPVASQQARPAAGACQPGPNALGVSRVVDIDATRGPRFGGVQYRDHDFLQEGEVVLTFDDGPHPAYTIPILDALDEHCVKATFFMVGRQALSFAKYAREVGRRGHTIGTHTWSHRNLASSSTEQMRAEIELGISAVQVALGGPTAPFFRFPYLAAPNAAQHMLQERDTANMSIDVDSLDFRTRSATRMINTVLNSLASKKKGIILFHDIQPATAAGIRPLLAELKARGYRVVHMRPKQTQSTIAEFDQRIERTHAPPKLEVAAGPVANRAVTAPGWEAQSAQHARPVTAEPRPRPRTADDWRRSVFGGGY
jgi:peptidoglycan-N-acetylglucosamine deacetylase